MLLPHRASLVIRPDDGHGFAKRQSTSQGGEDRDGNGQVPTTIYIVIGIFASVLCMIGIVWILRRRSRNTKSGKKGKYEQTAGFETSTRQVDTPANFDAAVSEAQRIVNRHNSTQAGQVTRETSVRSVLTLPPYRHNPNDSERVLGREGERDGVDVVVELPTAEDLEAMRDDEMEALYQVRVARREGLAQREELGRLREEARRRGDAVALEELRSQRRANNSAVDERRAAHVQAKERRQRAVSSVSYHDLGVARHDGTRIRAGSTDSERIGLLSDAASIAPSTRPTSSMHQRERSASSVLSFDSESGLPNSPAPPRSGAATPRLSNSHTLAGSSPEIIVEADLTEGGMPHPQSPPDYEEISLDDARSGTATPQFHEPPPHYPGPAATSPERDRRLSTHSDMVDRVGDDGDLSAPAGETSLDDVRRSSVASSTRGVGGAPQLPSLRIKNLPQIVIEPDESGPSNERR